MVRPDRRTLGQAIAADLVERLRAGELRAGDRLPPERALMAEFAVGRNTIREAVQSLVALGMLEVGPGTGTRVRSLDAKSVLSTTAVSSLLRDEAVTHLYDLRAVLETEAAARAATEASDDQISDMLVALEAYQLAVRKREEPFTHDIAIHRTIAAACTNPLFANILDATQELLSRARRETDKVPGATRRALMEHNEVVKAIADRDPEKARSAMHTHVNSAMWALNRARSITKDT
jgi:GntR family transcriptional regulator, transcriptional repressor for pyruvate dehydrogenase complex